MKKHMRQSSLIGHIFISLIAVAVVFVVIYTIFFLHKELSEYNDDVGQLKKNFSETKKLEIKNKILEIKNYIDWLTNHPEEPAGLVLKNKTDEFSRIITEQGEFQSLTPYTGILKKLKLPVSLIYNNGETVFTFNPWVSTTDKPSLEAERSVYRQILQSSEKQGLYSAWLKKSAHDSVLAAIGYFRADIFKDYILTSVISGEQITETLKDFVLDSVSKLRYSETDYVFINTYDGMALVTHGIRNDQPVDIYKSGDTNWIRTFEVQYTSSSEPKGVFLTYSWLKPGDKVQSAKTSFVSYFPEWRWFFGTGFHEDDAKIVIQAEKAQLVKTLKKNILFITIHLLLSGLLSYLLASHFTQKLKKNFSVFSEFFEKSVKENFRINLAQIKYKEMIFMGESANRMAAEKEKAEKNLNESKTKLEAALANMGDAVFIVDTEKNFIELNDAFARFIRFKDRSECPKKFDEYPKILEVYYPDGELRPAEQWAVPSALRGESGLDVEFLFKKKDSGETWIGSLNYAPVRDENGEITGAVVTAKDITSRKQAEAEIKKLNEDLELRVAWRTAQLESTNKELESFSYSVSHDLRAPLRAILGFSQILSTRHRSALNEEGRQYMDYIVEAGTRMEQLIDDLLNYSRIGRTPADLKVIPLTDFFESMHIVFKQQLESINASLIIEENLPEIISDKTLLEQIFSNLIANAIKYRRIEVSPEIRIGCDVVYDGYIIRISDNGIGIKKEFWIKIFDVFQRLHSEESYPGTGIGLASVKKAVSKLGGQVWVESIENMKSTFYVKLPVNN